MQEVQYSVAGTPVPDDYVLTPAGFLPRSSVHRVADGLVLTLDDDRLRRFTDATSEIMSLTEVPRPKARLKINPDWIAYAKWRNDPPAPINRFSTTWTVPQAPANPADQAIYLFNALLSDDGTEIAQPVLQWGASDAGGDQAWRVSCWYIGADGAHYRNVASVEVGDVLTGVITLTSRSDQSCNYRIEFLQKPEVALDIPNRPELTMATVTLEALRISDCNNYPASPMTPMTEIDLRTDGSPSPASLSWTFPETHPYVNCNLNTVLISTANPGGEVDIVYPRGN